MYTLDLHTGTIDNFYIWQIKEDNIIICSFYGPMAFVSAATVCRAMNDNTLCSTGEALDIRDQQSNLKETESNIRFNFYNAGATFKGSALDAEKHLLDLIFQHRTTVVESGKDFWCGFYGD